MRLLLTIIIFLGLLAQSNSQTSYVWSYTPNVGNPGALNAEADGSTSGWVSVIGISGLANANTWSWAQALPFSFNYYGTPVTHFKVSMNGLMTFDTLTTAFSPPANQLNANLPSSSIPNRTIAMFWDNFSSSPPTGANDFVQAKVFGLAPNRQFWVRWYSFEWGSGNAAVLTASVVLEETTNKIYIVEQQSSTPLPTDSLTVGLQQNTSTAVSVGNNLAFNSNTSANADNDYYTFTPLSQGNDAGLLAFSQPSAPLCGGSQNCVVNLANSGTNTLTSATINWEINGVLQAPYNWTGSLAPNSNTNVTIGNINIVTGLSYSFSATVTAPNGGSDLNNANNTASKSMGVPLAGSYTLNSALPTSASNFNSFADFSSYAENNGICSAVELNVLTSQIEQVMIYNVPGTSATNTITINGNNNTLSFTPTGSSRHILGLSQVSYLNINNLAFNAPASPLSAWGIWISNQSHHLTILNCTFDLSGTFGTSNGSTSGIALSATNNGLSLGNNGNDINIQGCTFIGAVTGVSIYGEAVNLATNIRVKDCTFSNFLIYGVNATQTSNLIVEGNEFSRIGNNPNISDFIGISASNGIGSKIFANLIHDTHTGATVNNFAATGISISGVATFAAYNDVYNNIIYNFTGSGQHTGIIANSASYCRIHHNTIDLDITINNTAATIGISQTGSAVVNFEILNNIVRVIKTGSTTSFCLSFSSTGSIINSNHNDLFYGGAAKCGKFGVTDFTTFALWQTANGNNFDQQSVSVDPMFVGLGDYTPTNVTLNSIGTTSFVTEDYWANPRIVGGSDLGAIEFSALGIDALLRWVSPTSPTSPGTHPIVVNIANAQVYVINSVRLTYTDGSVTVTQTFNNLNLVSGGNVNLTFTTPYTLASSSTITVTIDSVNNLIDANVNNNVVVRNLCVGMTGTYTINNAGGANFSSYSAAVNSLRFCGQSGPVTFNVVSGSGPYVEQVVIPDNIPGAAPSKPIVFNGNGTTLTFNATDTARHIIWIKGADYVTLRNINIVPTHANYGYGVLVNNLAEHVTIDGCTFNYAAVTDWQNYGSCAICATATTRDYGAPGTNVSNLTVQNCTMLGNASGGCNAGVIITGTASQPADSIMILNNNIQDFKFYAVNTRHIAHSLVSGNDFSRPNILGNFSANGLYTYGSSYNNRYERNRIHNFFNGNLGAASNPSIYGIYNFADGVVGSPNVFANNLIYDMRTSSTNTGIYTINADYAHYLHNTVHFDFSGYVGTNFNHETRGIFVTNAAVDVRIMNNIVRINRDGGVTDANVYGMYIQTLPTTYNIDYNDIYLTSSSGLNNTYWGYYDRFPRRTMANFKQVSVTDANSVDHDPIILGAATGNLTPANPRISGTGTNLLTQVPTDFNSASRTATPDFGAIEFTPPACPAPSNAESTQVYHNLINLIWRENGTATSWNLSYGTSAIRTGAGNTTLNNLASPSQTLSNLSSSTVYYVWVQSNCGGNQSTWTGPIAIRTRCNPSFLPWSENFDQMTNPGYLNFPTCWTIENGEWTTAPPSGNTASAPNAISGAMRALNTFWTPGIQLQGGSSYPFSFDYSRLDAFSYDIEVRINSEPQLAGSTLLTTLSLPNTGGGLGTSPWATHNMSLTPPATGAYYIGINVLFNNNYVYCGFDNFNIQAVNCTPYTVSVTPTNPTCFNGFGSATATTPQGANYPGYYWSNGQTGAVATGLVGAIYSVTVTDANGCPGTGSTTITEPAQVIASLVSQTNTLCYNQPTGTATISGSGGTAPLRFVWSNGQTNATATGLLGGIYTASVVDANGCFATQTVTIGQPISPLTINVSNTQNISCFGGSNGSVSLNTSGGTGAINYLWSNGRTTSSISGLAPNTYGVTATDQNGCSATASAALIQPSTALTITGFTNIPAGCAGTNTGAAQVNATGGTPNYDYLWSNGHNTLLTQNVAAGAYSVTVSDANGCSSVGSTTVTQSSAIVVNAFVTAHATCAGTATGVVTVSTSGGAGGYSFVWSNGQTNRTSTGLSAGVYTVTVTDGNGCTTLSSTTVTEPAAITFSISGSNPTGFGLTNGSVTSTTSGGTPNYTYTWSNGQNSADIQNLGAGNYCVTLSDANGCSSTRCVTLTQPAQLNVTGTSTPTSGAGANDGSVTTTVTGGVGPYTYNWSNGATTPNVTGLGNGTISVTVTDANGNTTVFTTNIVVGIEMVENEGNLTVFPNPADGQVNVKFELPNVNLVELGLYDINGRLLQWIPSNTASVHQWEIPLDGLPSGQYIIRCFYGRNATSAKLVIIK